MYMPPIPKTFFIIVMLGLIAFAIGSIIVEAQQTISCDTTQFGEYCLNPHVFPMDGYAPVDTFIPFVNPQYPENNPEHTDIGYIVGYYWVVERQEYEYLVVTNPRDPNTVYQLMRRQLVGRDDVIQVQWN